MYKINLIVPRENEHILHEYLKAIYKDVVKNYVKYNTELVASFTYCNNLPEIADIIDFGFFEIKITRLTPA